MLYFIGLGLGDEKDITVKGLEAVKSCKRVFIDAYTSILGVDKKNLESFYGIDEVILADRETVESQAEKILHEAQSENVAFLVVGDPFGATTHTDLYLRAIRASIPVSVIHNTSIINAVGACGLQLYNYGPIITIPFWTEKWRPASFYGKIADNYFKGLHTLCLLDIKVKEQSEENLFKGRLIYEPPRYMTVKQALSQLVQIEADEGKGLFADDKIVVGMMRIGHATQKILVGTVTEMLSYDEELYGGPLHSLILPGNELHELEFEMLKLFTLPDSTFKNMSFTDFVAKTKQ